MAKVRVATEGGGEQTLTLLALSRRLEDPATCADAVTALVHRGRARIVLQGGHRAILTYATPPAALPRSLPRPTGIARDYEINAGLMFEIPAHISVPRASSPAEASELARDVLLGLRSPPNGFMVEIGQDNVEAFITGLEIAGDGAPFGVLGVNITDVNERLLLTSGDAP